MECSSRVTRTGLLFPTVILALTLNGACIESSEAQSEHPPDGADTAYETGIDPMGPDVGEALLTWEGVVPGETPDDYWVLPIPDAVARGAVCNDGSPFVAYVRPGRNGSENRWIVFLKGGGGCNTVETCNARWEVSPSLMQAAGPNYRPGSSGIFDPDSARNPDWAEWTHVYLRYCSSDAWAGDREASDATGGWHFRGHRVLATALSDLLTPPEGIPSLSQATEVMLMGSSAGAGGVKHNLDFVADALPFADVAGVIDSAFHEGVPRDDSASSDRAAQGRRSYLELMNLQVDASCRADEPDPANCVDSTYVALNHISTPYFVYMDEFDGNTLSRAGVTSLCVPRECETSDQCGPAGTCIEGLCAEVGCSSNESCAGTCHEAGACYADSCQTNDDCTGGRACAQGFCIEAPGPLCSDSADCMEGACVSGFCILPQTCTHNSECGAGQQCSRQTYRCVPDIACGSARDCNGGEICLPRQQTPVAQDFARSIRELMAPLDGAFGTRGGFHTMLQQEAFHTRRIDGHTYAEVLGNWYFGRSAPTHVVAWEE